jgi:hypothetical protein
MPNGADLEFTIRRKVFTLFGAKFHIYNANGNLVGFSKQKAFKLKEDIRVYTSTEMSTELLRISARSVIDFSASYDVVESASGKPLGTLQRKGLKSIFRDEWTVLGSDGVEVGKIKEDSAGMAMVRRFLPMGNLFPQKFHYADLRGSKLAQMQTHFNPFVHRMTVRVTSHCPLNPMLMLAGGILLVAIEGRQSN